MSNNGIVYMENDNEALGALFGRPTRDAYNYLQNSVESYVSRVGGHLSGLADSVMERFKHLNSSSVINRVENMRHRLDHVWQTDSIRPLTNLIDIQQAPLVMQRWIMAAPPIRTSYNRDGCNGYEGSYVNLFPTGVGDRHYDFRRVMDGVVCGNKYTNYYEELLEQDVVLNIIEKNSILKTWAALDQILEETNSDPTDPEANGTIV